MEIPVHLEGARAARDLRTGDFTVAVLGSECRLREWTWGERRRLVEASLDGGQLHRERFVAGLCELLSPPPPAALAPAFASLALRLLGVSGGERPLPLAASELVLARELGWPPSVIDAQPASGLDRLVEQLAAPAPAASEVDSGWTRIAVDDD